MRGGNILVLCREHVPSYEPLQVILRISTEYLLFPVRMRTIFGDFNPIGSTVMFAFTQQPGVNPDTWFDGDAVQGEEHVLLTTLVGPANGGASLSPGDHYVWVKIFADPEIFVEMVGLVRIT